MAVVMDVSTLKDHTIVHVLLVMNSVMTLGHVLVSDSDLFFNNHSRSRVNTHVHT